MIPITVVKVGEEEEALVRQVLRSGMLAQGSMVQQFEQHCCEMTGAQHAVAVNNGTTALVVALEALQLQPGDEVVTSPFTFVATLNAILEAGATARFADVRDTDFNLDPDTLPAALTERTRVLLPVHLYGQAAEMTRIAAVADSHQLAIVEDAAQAHGAHYNGRPIGRFGQATFSFYATKNLNAGEGGVVTTDDDKLADRLRLLRNHGMRARYQYELAGHNYRLTDLAAAVAIPQFARLPAIIAARTANAEYFNHHLAGVDGLVTPLTLPGRTHAWHQYTVRITADCPVDRDTVLHRLNDTGIGAGVYYPRAVYDYECYRAHPRVHIDGGSRVAERVAGEVISLPVHQHLTEGERDQVVSAVQAAVRAA
ncbi:MAG TPA: DegT/DnrJ/EryC1/StrS family aminotransferase [Ilumatobacteraceae bacterium]|nr:DegT/DnrJ/EryC1/StrS family aminotransferase [Ilumatobacteraceae bacterium]